MADFPCREGLLQLHPITLRTKNDSRTATITEDKMPKRTLRSSDTRVQTDYGRMQLPRRHHQCTHTPKYRCRNQQVPYEYLGIMMSSSVTPQQVKQAACEGKDLTQSKGRSYHLLYACWQVANDVVFVLNALLIRCHQLTELIDLTVQAGQLCSVPWTRNK